MNPPEPPQLRGNLAFEHMVMSVLIAAAISAGAVLLVAAGEHIMMGRPVLAAAGGAFFAALRFGAVAFIVGFFAAVSIGLPLHRALERAKIRSVWPYVAMGLLLELIAAGFALKRTPVLDDFLAIENAPLLLPGVLAALLFGRRMRPLWKAAERAEESSAGFRLY